MCKDKDIKELLPEYAEQILDRENSRRVKEHLAACEDCRAETSLLRMMIADTVPDPGEAFWATMPDRVYRAVLEQKAKKRRFDASWFADRLTLPRRTLVAATVGVVIVISLFIVRTLRQEPDMPLSQEYESSGDIIAPNSVNVAELSQDEMDAVNTWAGGELTSIAQEAEPVLASSRDTDLSEELAALNAKEMERLSKMIKQWKRGG